MKYEIKPAVSQHRQHLTPAQRTSSLFSETPTVLGKVLRRGQSMTVTEEQMKSNESILRRLVEAGSITVSPLNPVTKEVTIEVKSEPEAAKPPVVTEPPEQVEAALTTAPDVVETPVATSVETVVVTEQVTVSAPPQAQSKKNKKG